MEAQLTYLPVYCYLEPETLDCWQSPDTTDSFLPRLTQAVAKKLGPAYSDLTQIHKLIVPPYLSLISVASEASRRNVPTVIEIWAQASNLPSISLCDVQSKLREHSPDSELQCSNGDLMILRKQARDPLKDVSNLVLELIPDHPAIGEKTIDGKLPCGAIDIPLLETCDQFTDILHRRWLQFTLPEALGRYDIDELELKLVVQMRKSLQFLAERVFTHIAEILRNREVLEKLTALKNSISDSLQRFPAAPQPPPAAPQPPLVSAPQQLAPHLKAYRDLLSRSAVTASSACRSLSPN